MFKINLLLPGSNWIFENDRYSMHLLATLLSFSQFGVQFILNQGYNSNFYNVL